MVGREVAMDGGRKDAKLVIEDQDEQQRE